MDTNKKIMKRILIKSMFALALMVNLVACEDYLGGDTNVNPNKVNEVSLNALLPTVIAASADNYYSVGFNTSQIVQYVASATATASNTDTHQNIRLGGSWTGIYLRALTNANIMVDEAEEDDSPHYAGIGRILMALNLGLATDLWGAIPFTEAFQADEELTPGFDDQEVIYENIQRLLNEAIEDLNAENSNFSPGADDLVYGGNLNQWIKAAYALKARYALHLSEMSSFSAADVLNFTESSFTSNADDLQLRYDSRNLNPWHQRPALANQTGNASITFSEQLIGTMNGDEYGVFDPRLPIIADNGSAVEYTGAINGAEGGELSNSEFTINTWYSRPNAPVLMITYAETKFIEAEASFLANGGTETSVGTTEEVYNDYLEGIKAHMEKLGVSPADINAYLTDPAVAVGASNLTLELIMKEKYIANFLNPETWVDFRRYDYSTNIYPDLELPLNHNPDLNGEWIRRILYPLDELSRNANEVERVQKGLGVKMWWDK
jgi:hypothetical protein